MNRVNLLPLDRQAAIRHRRARRRWVVINAVHLVVLVTIGVGYFATRSAPPDAAAGRAADLGSLNAKLVSLRQQSAALQAKARLAADGSDRPDFSYLLIAAARSMGEDILLDGIDVATAADGSKRIVSLAGVGRSHAAVTQFVLRVEGMRLFSAVRLTDTATRSANGTEGVGFRLQCALPGGAS